MRWITPSVRRGACLCHRREANRGSRRQRPARPPRDALMNKLVVATLAAAVSHTAGCVIETRSDGGHGSELASISARWSLRNMTDGATTACPRGFDTALLVSQPIDEFGVPLA